MIDQALAKALVKTLAISLATTLLTPRPNKKNHHF